MHSGKSYFLPGFLYPNSSLPPYIFYEFLSFTVFFLLEDLSRGVHVSTNLYFLHKSSVVCTLLCGLPPSSHSGDRSLPTYQALLTLLWHLQSPPTLGRWAAFGLTSPHWWTWSPNLSLLQLMLEQLSFLQDISPVLLYISPVQVGTPISNCHSMQRRFKAVLYTVIDRNFIP